MPAPRSPMRLWSAPRSHTRSLHHRFAPCLAVVVGVGGPRYLDVYIPLIGKELRVQVSDLAAPGPSPGGVVGTWDKQDLCAMESRVLAVWAVGVSFAARSTAVCVPLLAVS